MPETGNWAADSRLKARPCRSPCRRLGGVAANLPSHLGKFRGTHRRSSELLVVWLPAWRRPARPPAHLKRRRTTVALLLVISSAPDTYRRHLSLTDRTLHVASAGQSPIRQLARFLLGPSCELTPPRDRASVCVWEASRRLLGEPAQPARRRRGNPNVDQSNSSVTTASLWRGCLQAIGRRPDFLDFFWNFLESRQVGRLGNRDRIFGFTDLSRVPMAGKTDSTDATEVD
jgi:hypothetical protein